MAKRQRDSGEGLSEDDKVLVEAAERFKRAQNWEETFRRLFVIDSKFAYGDSDNGWQWPDDIRRDREVNKRPALTIPIIQTHLNLIKNDARQNKPSIKISPTDNEASFESAQVYEGLIRDIEYKSHAQDIYDDVGDDQVDGGIGYCRLEQYYPDEGSFNQALRISPVPNALSVLLDPDIKLKDGSDAKFGFIFDDVPRKEFEREHPDVDLDAVSSGVMFDAGDDWVRTDYVRKAEYYRILFKNDTLYWVRDAQGNESTFLASEAPKGFKDTLDAPGTDFKTREVKTKQLEWYLIAGRQIIKRDTKRKGNYIPIARAVGIEKAIEGRLERKGFVRSLKDAQRMYNYNAPLSLDTPIPTPTGWTSMRDVQAGDWVLASDGKPVEVVGTSPVYLHHKCYRIEFDGACSIIADGEHKWKVEERGKRKSQTYEWETKTLTTEELVAKKHFIYATKPLDLPEADLPVHPYVLGVWLGDGRTAGCTITSGFVDMADMQANLAACGYKVSEPRVYGDKTAGDIAVYGLTTHLRALCVLGNKHVPDIYLRASKEQRIALLQGLMDTDGCVSKANRQCVFTNTNPAIINAVVEVLNSLGIKSNREIVAASFRKFPGGNVSECQEAYRVSFSADPDICLFRLPRKVASVGAKWKAHARRTKRHRIVSITEVPSVPVKCITVNSPEHLFLAGSNMIPTHNSGAIEVGALQSRTPWTGAAAAFEGNEVAWNNANRNNAAYLTFKHLDSEGNPLLGEALPRRVDPPTPAPVFLQGMQDAERQMQLITGQFAAQQGANGNEKSGKAIQEHQRQSDIATYLFVNNLAIMIRHLGRMIVDLVPHIYDTKQVIQILGKDGTQQMVQLDPKMEDPYSSTTIDGIEQVLFNPAVGKYEVQADIGPAYSTQRQEAYNAFVQIVTGAPALIDEIGDLMFRSADFPLADKIAERLRRKIQANAPYLLTDGGVSPQIQQMQQALQQAQGQVGELIQKLAEKNLELKDRQESRNIESYKAEGQRLVDEATAFEKLQSSQIEMQELLRTIVETIHGMKQDNGQPSGAATTEAGELGAGDGSSPLVEANDIPPFMGAMKAASGAWVQP